MVNFVRENSNVVVNENIYVLELQHTDYVRFNRNDNHNDKVFKKKKILLNVCINGSATI